MIAKPVSLAVAAALSFAAAGPALADTIRCESDNGRERYCPVNTRGGVVLSTQLSSSGCYQGDTWGYDRNGVWVSGGCRAEFHTGGYGGYNYHQSNDYYYDGDRGNGHHNDGAKTAIALGAIVGAIAIAAAASKNKSGGSDSAYAKAHEKGCAAGRRDGRGGGARDYTTHDSEYVGRDEQAFAAGYNQCWTR